MSTQTNEYNEGYAARIARKKSTDNPYMAGTTQFSNWIRGWADASAESSITLKKNKW